MDITRGRELQERIGLDALTQWTLFGTATDTGMQERCIRIVGKTWDIPEEETQAWLDAIARERSYAESGSSEHVRPDDELPVNLSGLETLNMTWDLFETAAQMDDLEVPDTFRKVLPRSGPFSAHSNPPSCSEQPCALPHPICRYRTRRSHLPDGVPHPERRTHAASAYRSWRRR